MKMIQKGEVLQKKLHSAFGDLSRRFLDFLMYGSSETMAKNLM